MKRKSNKKLKKWAKRYAVTQCKPYKVLICFCLDVSSSMQGKPVEELNEGLNFIFEKIKNDILFYSNFAVYEIAVVRFGCEDGVKCALKFSELPRYVRFGKLSANSGEDFTPIGEAVNFSLDLIEQMKKADEKANALSSVLILMTDGHNNGKKENFDLAVKRCSEMFAKKKLIVMPIAIGKEVDTDNLSCLSFQEEWKRYWRNPMRLKDVIINNFIYWNVHDFGEHGIEIEDDACFSWSTPIRLEPMSEEEKRQWSEWLAEWNKI